MSNKLFIQTFFLLLVWTVAVLPGQAQDITNTPSSDSLKAAAPFVPRVSYGLNAGAGFSNLGSVSYVEPRVQYSVTPRFSVFSSLTMLQTWGGPTFRTSTGEGTSTLMTAAPDRQYLLHVGGSYAMSEKLLLSGSVWKDLNPSVSNRMNYNPFTYGRLPNQGFQFQAQYQVAPNFTVSGGVRYSNGANQNYGYGGYPGAGFGSPWGY
ncbi:hypothetical protein [Rufibacter latericius]|uniref:Outer membrane protein beta-barrel domain-containing protein n=1 Tax=Rufibacter latericius TaxID=2487040 RepID=A0A3M9ML12_9BACT|nr:hypothetical protein [Rufibacter latericius]RNI25885.1 hypothetical protein EFB08_13660 [Rufibacter latericius]